MLEISQQNIEQFLQKISINKSYLPLHATQCLLSLWRDVTWLCGPRLENLREIDCNIRVLRYIQE